MSRKKQVITMVTIALMCFLIGAIFNANLFTMANDDEDDRRPIWRVYVIGGDINVTNLPLDEQGNLKVTQVNGEQNVTVTNWPEDKNYVFFNYKYGRKPTIYISPLDTEEYVTGSSSWKTIKEYTIDATKYTSNLSTSIWFELECSVNDGTRDCDMLIVVNGQECMWSNVAIEGQWTDLDLFCNKTIDMDRTDNEVLVKIRERGTTQFRVKNLRYKLHYYYNKTTLTPDAFGVSALYLKSLALGFDDAVVLNGDTTQTITGPASFDFSMKILVTQIEFLSGNPEIVVYAEV